jgi:uncharacterized protein (TIGR03435 family)
MKFLVLSLLGALAVAQPVFEVASITKSNEGTGVRGGCHGIDTKYSPNEAASAPPLGRCVIRDARLSHLLFIAYELRSMSSLKGGADWVMMGDDRFTVQAKAEDPTKATEEDLHRMLKALLIERFHVKLHEETKDVSGFGLVIAKNGPKLKEAKGDDVSVVFSPGSKPNPRGPNTMTARKFTMQELADLITQFSEPVLNQTGLTGAYDFTLSWNEVDGPSMTTALQEQLGLKLESRKVPISTLVIESAQKPSEN